MCAAAHAGGSSALRGGDRYHAVRFRVQAGLVLFGVRDRIAQTGFRRGGDHVDAIQVQGVGLAFAPRLQYADEGVPHAHELLERAQQDRRHERTVDVAYLFLGVGGQLDERRRMSTAFRLARIVRPLPAARTTVVSATVHVAFSRPAIEDGGPAALGGGEERRAWPLAPFLRSDGQRHAVFECLVEYHRVVDGDFLGRHIWGVHADAPTVRRQPVLPVGQHHWTASQRAVRLPAVTFDPCAHQMPQRGEVDEP